MGFFVYFTDDKTEYYDSDACELHLLSGEPIKIDSNSKIIFDYLVENHNAVKTRGQIIDRIDGIEESPDYNIKSEYRGPVDNAIKVLRKKLGKYGSYIDTVRGRGYKYIGPPKEEKNSTNSQSPMTSHGSEVAPQEVTAASLSCIFERGKDNPGDVFVLPDHFIIPHLPMQQLLDTAFLDSNIHVISGQRGMGKSELARYFSRVCCGDESCRDALKYNTVIWTSYSERGLKDTISKLNYSEDVADNQLYSDKIRLLFKIKKPCLLVIDNFDNEISFAEELSGSSSVYMDLLRCGCHILLTSKVDLSDCYAVRQTEILPLPESHLNSLFWELSEEEKTKSNQEKASELIGKYLDRNTYLVILAARLTETSSIDDILKAFKKLTVAQMADPISAEKDGTKQFPASLLSQYETMFNLSSVRHDLCKTRLLYNLSLLPIDGMPYNEFFSSSFRPEEQEAMRLAFSQLRDSFWVFLRRRQVCIHPLIREMIISTLSCFDYSYIQQYIRSLNDRLFTENYTERTSFDLKYAVAAYEVCEKLAVRNLDMAKLVSNIAATYDLVKNPDEAYYYSKQAMHLLQTFTASNSFDDDLALASCYNMVGYAILHTYAQADSKEIAEQALLRAKSITDNLPASDRSDDSPVYLRTKIEGNLAALYITKKEYDRALNLHRSALNVRLQLVEDCPSPRTKLLLAAAYKGIATDYFYLSRQQKQHDALSLLQSSLENHRYAVALYEEVLSVNSLEACTAINRLVSTGVNWLTASAALSQPVDFQAKIAVYIDKTLSAAQYLRSIEPIAYETSICISNAEGLANYLDSMKCYDIDYLYKLEEIANLIFSIDSDKKSEWINSISAILRITSPHIQEKAAYERYSTN